MNCKSVNILLLFVASTFLSFTSLASEVIDVQPTQPRGDFQSWTIGDARVSVYASCRRNRGDLFQIVGTCSPSVGIHYDGKKSDSTRFFNTNSASLYVGKSSLTSRDFLASDESKKIIEALSKGNLAKIIISYSDNTRPAYQSYTVNLMGFNEAVSAAISGTRFDAKAEADKHNSIVGITILVLLLSALGTVWYIKTKAVPKVAQVIVKKKQELQEKSEVRQVAKIAKEETIRETVRQSVSEASDEQINVLKQQIKEALDKDDTKTATTLMTILSEKENAK
ncbi:hypothetical protein [Aliivibrio fischeri]|uniref:hypothetical protein n=1 Tax=Aliivibrio fischeri TaxID=668 RepID=UPI0012DA2CD9|nr:hypothetical protein [Aliivibrio fischeri]MUK70156.1 hypothetical protein [Aliivibrio fischeri]MUK72690.1 hypothetical protein [Aliivibrio fischeri]